MVSKNKLQYCCLYAAQKRNKVKVTTQTVKRAMNKIAAHFVHPIHFLYHTHAQLILKTTAANAAKPFVQVWP